MLNHNAPVLPSVDHIQVRTQPLPAKSRDATNDYRVTLDAGPWLVMLAPVSLALTLACVIYLSKLSF